MIARIPDNPDLIILKWELKIDLMDFRILLLLFLGWFDTERCLNVCTVGLSQYC